MTWGYDTERPGKGLSDQPQLWHRDVPLELKNIGVEHAFTYFMLVNLDCRMDGRENMFVYGSSSSVPYQRPFCMSTQASPPCLVEKCFGANHHMFTPLVVANFHFCAKWSIFGIFHTHPLAGRGDLAPFPHPFCTLLYTLCAPPFMR